VSTVNAFRALTYVGRLANKINPKEKNA